MWCARIAVVAGLVVGLGAVAACADDTDEWPAADVTFTEPGVRFEVEPGDEFTIVLESNITTGYSWTLETEPPRDIVRSVGDVYVAPTTEAVGAAGRQELSFEAVGDGSTVLRLWYVRGFDDPPVPADRAEFGVVVGDGGSEPAADDADALTVGALLAEAPDAEVLVTGVLFDDGSGPVLCEVLAESFPPQCVGERVAVDGPGVDGAAFTVADGIRWTDRPVRLTGRLVDGVFTVG